MLSLEGKQLGNYDIIRRIRVGGMGAVYEGRQRTAFDRRVAIKVILGDYATDRDMRRRFLREARTVAALRHPHILPLFEFGEEHGILFLVMPFIEGGTLTGYLRRGLPGIGEVAAIYQQLLDAVEYAHDEGLIHRDIKSSNVLLDVRRNGPPYIYLADFGLVRIAASRRRKGLDDSRTGRPGRPIPLDQVPGTPQYMAPEQTRGIITPQTDIYALGVLLYQLLTGDLPYNHEDDVTVIKMHLYDPIPRPSDRDTTIPRALDDVVRTAMAKRPEERYRTIAELRDAFLSAIESSRSGPVIELFEEAGGFDGDTLTEPEPGGRAYPLEELPSLPEIPTFERAPRAPDPSRRLRPAITAALVPEQQPVVLEKRARPVHTTDDFQPRARTTEDVIEPPKRRAVPRHRRLLLPLLFCLIATSMLLTLLILPHVFGISIFPAGFPVLGTPGDAMIYVTPESKTLENSFVLSASPQSKVPSVEARTLPDRVISKQQQGSSTIQAQTTRTVEGAQARGQLEFYNTNLLPVTIPAQTTLDGPNGLKIQTLTEIKIPGRTLTEPGRATTDALVTTPGSAGNIPPETLNGPCCSKGVTVRNPEAFSGGVDGQVLHVIQNEDVEKAKATLTEKLQKEVRDQITKALGKDETLAGQPELSVKATVDPPLDTQPEAVTITIRVDGRGVAYRRAVAEQLATRLLELQAKQQLKDAFTLHDTIKPVGALTARNGPNNIIFLTVTVRGTWLYHFSKQEIGNWPESVKGATVEAALAYLNQQHGIANVEVKLPFGSDHLPGEIERIKVVVVTPDRQ
ncbi:serine/threonine protein kinase [Thermosporothrix hazakensis]|jgi:serine/threonine protein kinase|uniref:Serine/threonine protein kinase n=1 Tax=Thermosporothrix hazakensis TaxID=644383 RepID=A0A326U1U9_THEHA|nr:serine/threonine-protein kinase [Thermosporothrix hazakensis]PZW24906.1 serine/threonine protein kinase [Thermosporothrix hazakensis]GCE46408.1 hypothetical protein KTH_12770 [Thermosporothrix hazakensis]